MPRPHVAFFQMRAYRQALSISFDILQGMILERSSDVTWTLWFASRTITDMASSLPPFQFGPYLTPVISRGARVMCEVRGLVKIVGLSDGPIPWPIGERDRKQALIVYKGLARAVRCAGNLSGTTGSVHRAVSGCNAARSPCQDCIAEAD